MHPLPIALALFASALTLSAAVAAGRDVSDLLTPGLQATQDGKPFGVFPCDGNVLVEREIEQPQQVRLRPAREADRVAFHAPGLVPVLRPDGARALARRRSSLPRRVAAGT